jgi:hypothetical protein
MGKTATITARIEPKLKARAGRVLARAGVVALARTGTHSDLFSL